MSGRIEGADQLRGLARSLKAAGDPGKGLRRELLAEIRKTAKGPLLDELKAAALSKLPSRGGLASYAAKNLKVTVRTRLSGQQAGVTVLAAVKNMDLPKLETGKLRHPVYGRGTWVSQSIPPRIFEAAAEQVAEEVAKQVLAVVDDVTRKV